MKTFILFFFNLILSFWGNLMEELSKMEFSQEGIMIISGIITFVVVGLIVMTIKERIEKKKEQEHPPTQHPNIHHHHHHHRHKHHRR